MSEDLSKEDLKEKAKEAFDSLFRVEVEVKDGGTLPAKAHPSDAGFDLFAAEDIVLYPGQVLKTPLNIHMKLPVGSWGRIETKSGLGAKGMLVYAGVIDRNYRGVPHVIMTNLNAPKAPVNPMTNVVGPGGVTEFDEPIIIKKGEKVAQLTMNPHNEEYYVVQVDVVEKDTDRGQGGFGSTGA